MKNPVKIISLFLIMTLLFSVVNGFTGSAQEINIDGIKDSIYTTKESMTTNIAFTNPGGAQVFPNTTGISATVWYAWDDTYLYFYISSTPGAGILDFKLDPDPQIGTPSDLNTNFNPNSQTDGHLYFRIGANGSLENRTSGAKATLLNSTNLYRSGNGASGHVVELKWPRAYPGTNSVDSNSFKLAVILFTADSKNVVVFNTNNWNYYSGLTEIKFPEKIDGVKNSFYTNSRSVTTNSQFANPGGAPVTPVNAGVGATVWYTWDDDYLYFYISSTPGAGILDFKLDPDPQIGTPSDLNTSFNPNSQTDGHMCFRINANGSLENRTGGAKAALLSSTNLYRSGNGASGHIVELRWPRAYPGTNTIDSNSFKFAVVLFMPMQITQ